MSYSNGVASATPQERLHQRLGEPETAEALLQLLDKLEVVNLTVDSVDGFLRRGDQIIENVADSVGDLKKAVPSTDLNLEQSATTLAEALPVVLEALPALTQSLPLFLQLAERLNEPGNEQALHQIIDRMELVAFSLESVDGFLQRGDAVIENIADGVNEIRKLAPENELNLLVTLAETLPQLTALLPQLVNILPQLVNVLNELETILHSPEFEGLMTSGVFSPKTVGIVGKAGNALVESYDAHQLAPQYVGPFGVLKAANDPDIQRALGFLVEFGKKFGDALKP